LQQSIESDRAKLRNIATTEALEILVEAPSVVDQNPKNTTKICLHLCNRQ
jgi:hypothetical protein